MIGARNGLPANTNSGLVHGCDDFEALLFEGVFDEARITRVETEKIHLLAGFLIRGHPDIDDLPPRKVKGSSLRLTHILGRLRRLLVGPKQGFEI